jgi:hypothetical protein
MSQRTMDIPDSEFIRIAKRALEYPGSFMRYDERIFDTHGLVFAWADRGDDLLAESNYHVMLEELRGVVAHEDNTCTDEDLIEGSEGHWLVGHLSTIYVRVFEDCTVHGEDCEDPALGHREFTVIFKEAAALLLKIEDYPILDESDYYEREYAAWQANVWEALDSAISKHSEDTEAEWVAFFTLLTFGARACPGSNDVAQVDLWDLFSHGESSPDSVDWEAVQAAYDAVRDAHFERLALEWVAAGHNVPANQLPLYDSCGCSNPYCQV